MPGGGGIGMPTAEISLASTDADRRAPATPPRTPEQQPLAQELAQDVRARVTPSAIAVPISPVRSSTLIIIVLEMLSTMITRDDQLARTATCREKSSTVLL